VEFTAIDFETANASRDSACAIGLVTVKDGVIVDEYYHLIRPKIMYFNPDNIGVHGITEEMVANEPNFEQLWPEIFPRLHNKQVVAHFAKFDINVLRYTLNSYYLPHPNFTYICSWVLAKKAFPHLSGYSLDNVAGYVGFKFQHHQALDDARACAAIVNKVLEKNPSAQDFEHLADIYNFECGHLSRNKVHPCTLEKEVKEEIMGKLF
jgi:DNA polymerase-3 subunit epsilon